MLIRLHFFFICLKFICFSFLQMILLPLSECFRLIFWSFFLFSEISEATMGAGGRSIRSRRRTRNLNSLLANLRKQFRHTASTAPFSDHCLTSFTTTHSHFCSTTLPLITSTSSLLHFPTLRGPFTGFSKAVFSLLSGLLAMNVVTMPLVAIDGLTILSDWSSTPPCLSRTSRGSTVTNPPFQHWIA